MQEPRGRTEDRFSGFGHVFHVGKPSTEGSQPRWKAVSGVEVERGGELGRGPEHSDVRWVSGHDCAGLHPEASLPWMVAGGRVEQTRSCPEGHREEE